MSQLDRVLLPLVDEPIGRIVERVGREQPEVAALAGSPQRMLAFRTFAHIQVGIVLGELLFEHDLPPYDGSESWVDTLLGDERHYAALARGVRVVASEIAADPDLPEQGPLGPDDAVRQRFREFVREQLRPA